MVKHAKTLSPFDLDPYDLASFRLRFIRQIFTRRSNTNQPSETSRNYTGGNYCIISARRLSRNDHREKHIFQSPQTLFPRRALGQYVLVWQ